MGVLIQAVYDQSIGTVGLGKDKARYMLDN